MIGEKRRIWLIIVQNINSLNWGNPNLVWYFFWVIFINWLKSNSINSDLFNPKSIIPILLSPFLNPLNTVFGYINKKNPKAKKISKQKKEMIVIYMSILNENK